MKPCRVIPTISALGFSMGVHAVILVGFFGYSFFQTKIISNRVSEPMSVTLSHFRKNAGAHSKSLRKHRTQNESPLLVGAKSPIESSNRSDEEESGKDHSGHASAHYSSQIRDIIDSTLHYPISVQRRGIQGQVIVRIILDRSGNLKSFGIFQSSGSDELDELALQAIRDAAPFPSPPGGEKLVSKIDLNLPIRFRIR